MYIEKISLLNFKNYEQQDISFSPEINVFTGTNGSGKTNLLDAIYCLALTKSAFNSTEQFNVRHTSNYFSILGHVFKQEKVYEIQYDYSPDRKKNFRLNKVPYEKLSEHIGFFPVVLMTPHDTDIIREGSELRRRFLDGILSQINNIYLLELVKYNNLLKQRNKLLKQFWESGKTDLVLLETYDEQLLGSGRYIYDERKTFLDEFVPVFEKHYRNISESKELAGLEYSSQLNHADFEKKFSQSLQRDIATQRTHRGIHKDDLLFTLDAHPLKNFGSQGQQKSFAIALKLAQYELLKSNKKIKPLLLLDDIFDKLDDFRIKKLIELVIEDTFGQLFITDARRERTEAIIKDLKANIRIFNIESGKVLEESNVS